ncbi:hypothetical protein B0H17DRAFT_1328630 [Mycena rosella]|uniref:STAS domain-containing protein n=1 Tax=Mycena rosella TaxID=1033263 RepID=A0AAD7DUT4_MYCRO|nr:hypothetical protein B0H17DRAFT_1328630 [Mycena rosella]
MVHAELISASLSRLYRGLPAVLLGTLFTALHTVAFGTLIFPPANGFRALELQGISMYIISTLSSQLVLTFGGSRFRGGLCGMLVEVLPFIRGLATDIRGAIGDDHPGLVPTVMAAYALTSFLIGAVFLILGALKLGNLVPYFPQTVLTGAIGAIGVSFFILGLGLPFPPSAPPLSLSNAATTLFNTSHLGPLTASFFPALILSITLRAPAIGQRTRGLVRSPYYIPLYLFTIPVVFWTVVGLLRVPKSQLIVAGWLFDVESPSSASAVVASWNYWKLFNFTLVEWRSFTSAIQNIVLLVVFGVLNLPIYIPALAFTLDVSYDMNHELLASNILAGLLGTAPNMIKYSYSVYLTRANGSRFESILIILLMVVFFLTSGLILPYVPTVLASALVLFLGVELFLKALWEGSNLTSLEYCVVVATLCACSFLGFAQGFAIGIGAAMVVYLLYSAIDTRAKVMQLSEWSKGRDSGLRLSKLSVYQDQSATGSVPQSSRTLYSTTNLLAQPNAVVIILSGYIFFASVPSIEAQLLAKASEPLFIIDLTRAHRMETSAARCLPRWARELELRGGALAICGLEEGGRLHSDLKRAEVPLVFDIEEKGEGKEILTFETQETCLVWCQHQHELRIQTEAIRRRSALKLFCHLFDFNLPSVLGILHLGPNTEVECFIDAGGGIKFYLPGQTISPTGIIFTGSTAFRKNIVDDRALPDTANHFLRISRSAKEISGRGRG